MERRTQVLLGLGLALAVAATGALAVTFLPGAPTLAATWVSDPPEGAGGNHHGVAVGTVDGRALVYAPVSGPREGPACGLSALDAATGALVWRHPVPPADCTVHAVADPSVAEWRGRPAVLVATTEHAVFDLDPATGEVRARYDLASYGYTPPQVVDLVPGGPRELLVADARGTVQLIAANGTAVWREPLDAYVWATPVVGDLAGDGRTLVALGTDDGRLLVLSADGDVVRTVEAPLDGAVTWLTSGGLDEDPAVELVAATARGRVVAVDGATGAVEWTRDFGSFAAVGAVGDAEGDGDLEVYVTAADGAVRALDGATGRTVWDRQVAADEVQMMPPPAFGDVTGEPAPELVVASNDGRVVVLEPASGRRLAGYDRDAAVFESPTLGDVDDDGGLEVFVIYVDGAVVRLDFEA